MNNKQKGFIIPLLIIIIAVLVGVIYLYSKGNTNQQVTINSELNNRFKDTATSTAQSYFVDLNNDGNLDLLLLPQGNSDFCGNGGCQLMIFINNGNGNFVLNSTVGVTRSVFLPTTSTNGWRDIITAYSGGGGPSGFTKIQFDGKKYSDNASVGPAVKSVSGLEQVL